MQTKDELREEWTVVAARSRTSVRSLLFSVLLGASVYVLIAVTVLSRLN